MSNTPFFFETFTLTYINTAAILGFPISALPLFSSVTCNPLKLLPALLPFLKCISHAKFTFAKYKETERFARTIEGPSECPAPFQCRIYYFQIYRSGKKEDRIRPKLTVDKNESCYARRRDVTGGKNRGYGRKAPSPPLYLRQVCVCFRFAFCSL